MSAGSNAAPAIAVELRETRKKDITATTLSDQHPNAAREVAI
ncbi:MAG: hypothetical protein ACK5YO_29715 [Planctomyces sp.]